MFSGAASPGHLLIILAIALIVLGPTELPKLLRTVSSVRRQLRALQARVHEEINEVLDPNTIDEARGPQSPSPSSGVTAPE